jgi:hypothetical protein
MEITMTRGFIGFGALVLFATVALAQNPAIRRDKKEKDLEPARETSWGRITPSESMWLYEQHKRDYLDPQIAMRRRAEYNAWQRRYRLAHMNWYGYSNSRPVWHHTPFMTAVPSPSWTGNDADPNRWHATPSIVVRPYGEANWK